MTSILGISAFYHDSAAALIVDGDIVAAAQEERFSRKKHDPRYPFNAIKYVLKESNLELNKIDHVIVMMVSSLVSLLLFNFPLKIYIILSALIALSVAYFLIKNFKRFAK